MYKYALMIGGVYRLAKNPIDNRSQKLTGVISKTDLMSPYKLEMKASRMVGVSLGTNVIQ
jgi:hypothetical protein